jgi:hypothetical protein
LQKQEEVIEPIAILIDKRPLKALTCTIAIFTIVIALAFAFDPMGRTNGNGLIYTLGTIGLGVLLGLFLQTFDSDKPIVEADELGIASQTWFGSRKLLKWDKVATCEITIHYDTFGRICWIDPRLKSAKARTLLRPRLKGASISDQLRLVEWMKVKFAKDVLDDWGV